VILAGSGLTAPIARIVSMVARAPYAVLIHGLDVIVPNRLYQTVFVPCLRAADALIANSEHTAELARKAGMRADAITVLHPGVEFPAPEARGFREKFGIGPKQPLLLSVGRIVHRKGLPAFIAQSMPALMERFPDLMFAIIGEEPAAALHRPGAEIPAIREAIARKGIEDSVKLCGGVTDELLHAAYAEADALVFPVLELPGDVEGFGMVAVEAAAHGLPTFGFRSGGVPDAVRDGNTGELVAAGDYRGLADRIARHLATREARAYREACLAHAKAHGWSHYGARLESSLGSITKRAERGTQLPRGYQYGYSSLHPEVNDAVSRERKANTALAVIEHHLGRSLHGLRVVDVGGSGGVMAASFARAGAFVTAIDIDEPAIVTARERFKDIANLEFQVGDAMALDLPDKSTDVVLCCHVYEHVPDAARLMSEIHRVLRPGGICYFSAGNRCTWREPHYGLPLLSVMPPALAHHYLRLLGRGDFYHERHLSYGGLRRLVNAMELHDYTCAIVEDPARFGAEYMIHPGSMTQRAARTVLNLLPQIFPNFIWLLKRPTGTAGTALKHGTRSA
jgi:phosphatidylinositol alpha-1,6-mannosyltransferase